MDTLLKLPKLNKAQFISSFVTTQQANATSYAEEGRVAALTWQLGSDTSKSNRYLKSIANPGFATPVLKPRKRLRTETSMREQPPATQFHPDPPHSRKTSRVVHNKRTQKRQVVSDDDDQLARLAERRTRKRAKREIVRPKSPDAPSAPNINTKRSKSDAKGRGRRAIDGAPALALMHGFSASNIGKNRLTLKMNANNFGVFNKGKASSKIHVQQSKTVVKNIGLAFSEKQFLNKGSTPSVKPKHFMVSAMSSGTDLVTESASNAQPRSSKGQVANDSLFDRSSDDDEAPQNTSKAYTEPAVSEVWDIEIDDFELPSVVSESKSTREQKLDTCQAAWSCQIQRDDLDRGNATSSPSLVRSNDDIRRPSSSIAPSQSASQYPPLRKAQSLTTSKYFRIPSASGEGLVQEALRFHQLFPDQPPPSTYPIDHNNLGNSTSHEEFECHSPIKRTNAIQDSLVPNSAQNEVEYVPIPPVDDHQNFYHPTSAFHCSDTDLSYPGYSVQECAWSPGSTCNNKKLIDDAVLVDMNYNDINYLDATKGPGVGTGLNDQPFVYHDHGYPFHDDYRGGIEIEAQPEIWETESCRWEGEDYLRLGVKEYAGSTLEEGWCGEIEDGIDYESSDDVETGSNHHAGFLEGRELLLGLTKSSKWAETGLPSMGLAAVEADVVANMKSHWRPQRL
ncbi:hypothetical protein E1B28_004430 [Marasmius oreades]|nr:uncharacterized protein E1B28_004430 [Marasmius oreades]KAG7097038.1 hypothetical protein E1B28_004430 [Marasmius oreades]